MANKHFTFTGIRILFPAILRSKPNFSGNGEEYSFVMLIPKSNKQILSKFQATYGDLVKTEFKTPPAGLRPAIGSPHHKAVLKNGDQKYQEADIERKPTYEPYKGHY